MSSSFPTRSMSADVFPYCHGQRLGIASGHPHDDPVLLTAADLRDPLYGFARVQLVQAGLLGVGLCSWLPLSAFPLSAW